jgi:hypothetical protein
MAAGLPLTESKFCILPPHFHCDTLSKYMKREDWESIVPCYNTFPESFKKTIPYLLASVVYHSNFLETNLSKRHPLFQTRLWRNGYIKKLVPHVILVESYCQNTKMRSTGIPPNMVFLHLMKQGEKQLQDKLHLMSEKIFSHLQEIDSKLKQLPEDSCNAIQNRFVIDGAVPLTRQDLLTTIDGLRSSILSEMHSSMNRIEQNEQDERVDPLEDTTQREYSGKLFCWSDGSMHRAPEDWLFPSINCKTMWDLWHKGDPSLEIGPFKCLAQSDCKQKKSKVQLSRAKGVMDKIIGIAIERRCVPRRSVMSKLSTKELDVIFDECFSELMQENTNGECDRHTHCRPEEISYGTLYNLMKKEKRKRQRIE